MTSDTKRTPLFPQFGKKSSYLEILGLNHKGADSLFSGVRFELYLFNPLKNLRGLQVKLNMGLYTHQML